MKKTIPDYAFLFTIAGVIIALDQWTKSLVRAALHPGAEWSPAAWLFPYFRIVNWQNDGAAFGIFQGFGGIFTILAILVSIAIVYYFPRVPRSERTLRLAMCLQFAGALGNLLDRLYQGFVTDFISLLAVLNMPVFNIADLSITTGVIVLILGVWINERKQRALAATAGPQPSTGEAAPPAGSEEARSD